MPLDYAGFSRLRSFVTKHVHHPSIASLRNRLKVQFRRAFPPAYVRRVTSKFRGRIQRIVTKQGGYIEKELK